MLEEKAVSSLSLADPLTALRRTQRVDLHVHSKHSGMMRPIALQKLQVRESYTEPEDLYRRMLARDMSMVTITDHDEIAGCLEIMHHGDHVFISEEISTHFPGTGCILHILAYGITEAQHDEIQRLRFNIFDLVAYLRAEGVTHSWAHPFSLVTYRMTPDLLRQSFLLFDTIELTNGQHDPGHEFLLRQALRQLDRDTLAAWANRYDIEPAAPDGRWAVTAGSDDHSGFTLARSYVEFEGEPSLASLRDAIADHRAEPKGLEKTGTSYAHTVYAGTLGFLLNSHPKGASQSVARVGQLVANGKMPGPEDLDPVLQRLMPAAMKTLAAAGGPPSLDRILSNAHRPEVHDEIYTLVNETLLDAFRSSFAEIRAAVEEADLERIIDELPTLIRLSLFNVPYYFGFSYFNGERRRGRTLYTWLDLDNSVLPADRVAIFADTLDELSGVSIGLRRSVSYLRAQGHEIWLCGPETRTESEHVEEEGGVVRFPSLTVFPLLGYGNWDLGLPSLLEVVRWLDEKEIDLVQISTPGPAGWIALAASRVLGIPAIGYFHTDVPAFAELLLDDPTAARVVAWFVRGFYSALERVTVPTHAAAGIAADLGVPEGKLDVVQRGVDTEIFNPDHLDPEFWKRHGLRGRNTLLFVGRVSVEKNLPFLAQVVHLLVDREVDFELAIVGEGPYCGELRKELEGTPVIFTGVFEGADLAMAFASADLLVFPSNTDTLGNVVLEAHASGIPALVSDRGGPCELTRHGQTGWVVPAGEPSAWADTIARLLDDPEALRCAGEAAREHACERRAEDCYRAQWEAYEACLADIRRRSPKQV